MAQDVWNMKLSISVPAHFWPVRNRISGYVAERDFKLQTFIAAFEKTISLTRKLFYFAGTDICCCSSCFNYRLLECDW